VDRPADIEQLAGELEECRRAAAQVAEGLSAELSAWRAAEGTWSVAQCLDHLATGNRVYVAAMRPSAARARERGRLRRRPAKPGLIGGWFVRSLEPPVKPSRKLRAPRLIRPRPSPALADALAAFLASEDEVVSFLRETEDLDLAGVHFPNPFIRGVRFSLATGFHVLAAHQRRHLWQARRVREQAEAAPAAPGKPSGPRLLGNGVADHTQH
jgi:hypothetical protein